MRPLAIPTGLVLRCRVVPPERAARNRPDLIEREYELTQTGSISERLVQVAHDSAGRPVFLAEITALASPVAPELYVFVLHFRARGGVDGFAHRMDTTVVRPGTPPGGADRPLRANTGRRPLRAQEIADARALADWLWVRRCVPPGQLGGVSRRCARATATA